MGESCCGPSHGHGHTSTEQVEEMEQGLPMAGVCCGGASGGCGDGAGGCDGGSCGSGGGCGGHSHGPQFDQVETAVMRGFLSGVFATVLPREKLVDYLKTMSQADGSEFQGPANFLLQALEATPPVEGKPAAISLVETVTGETLSLE